MQTFNIQNTATGHHCGKQQKNKQIAGNFLRESICNGRVTENFICILRECIFNDIDDEQHQK